MDRRLSFAPVSSINRSGKHNDAAKTIVESSASQKSREEGVREGRVAQKFAANCAPNLPQIASICIQEEGCAKNGCNFVANNLNVNFGQFFVQVPLF